MDKKEYVLQVTEAIKANPRPILAGHGLPAVILQMIASREDVIAKLATCLYSFNYAKKGAAGLKKQQNFRLFGYKNFGEFNGNAREDIEEFVAGLSEDDQKTFSNESNVVCILFLPDISKSDAEKTLEERIVSGKSVPLAFNNAVTAEYRQGQAMYITLVWGASATRDSETKVALRKEKQNKAKDAKRTPARIKRELQLKAKKEIEMLEIEKAKLQNTASNLRAQNTQLGNIATALGGGENVLDAINKYDANIAEIKARIEALDATEKSIVLTANKFMKAGNVDKARKVLAAIDDETIVNYVLGQVKSSNDVLSQRKNSIKAKIAELTTKNDNLLAAKEIETDPKKKLSISSMISQNIRKIKELRGALGTYKNISPQGLANKAALVAETQAKIEELAKKFSISEALNIALKELAPVTSATQRQIIKQETMQKIQQNVPPVYAVQQALQKGLMNQAPAIQQTIPQQIVTPAQQKSVQQIIDEVTAQQSIAPTSYQQQKPIL